MTVFDPEVKMKKQRKKILWEMEQGVLRLPLTSLTTNPEVADPRWTT